MKAIQFNFTIPRYILGFVLGRLSPSFYWSGLSCTEYKDIPKPGLPGEDWVMIKTRMGGICGTDTAGIECKGSVYLNKYFTYPFVLGHENIGVIDEIGKGVSGWQVGDRVVVEPALWCKPRGFDDFCFHCAKGEINRCERITLGNISPGIFTGLCQDTGGSWSKYFVAHESQLYLVPDAISSENALMIEPFACAIHAVLQNFPYDDDKVLIIGAGSVGLCTLAALRSLGSKAEIIVLSRYRFQTEAAQRLGADRVIQGGRTKDYYDEVAKLSGAIVQKPLIVKQLLIGGVDITFECVGSKGTLVDAFRLTRNGGRVILMGTPGIILNLDWTPIVIQNLDVKAEILYHHAENYEGRTWKAFDLAIELMSSGKVDLSWMVTHKFPLDEYKKAFELTKVRGKNGAIKIAFEFED
jgi:threonine dehydrogenase-like Zn-dependent dehydrogenase